MEENNNPLNKKDNVETAYPLMQHLSELRKRLMYTVIFVFIIFCISYSFGRELMQFVLNPLVVLMPKGSSVSFLKITEGFITELKLSAMAAIFFSMPFILYQVWRFIAPALYTNEKKYVVSFVVSASLLFFMGASFAYYVVFPFGFKFFLKYASPEWNMVANISVDWYLSFVIKLVMAFGFVFELPVVVFFLSVMGLITDKTLIKYRRYSIVGIFIVAAVLTPPDVISQIAMAIPLLILYEISVVIARIFGKKKKETKDIELYE